MSTALSEQKGEAPLTPTKRARRKLVNLILRVLS
jgi:hypothetical protein